MNPITPSEHLPPARTAVAGLEAQRGAQVRVYVQEQDEDAKVERQDDGLVLCVKSGVLSSRAFVALVLALGPVLEQGREYLQSAS